MKGPVLIDAGPLVAYLVRSDHYHDWAVAQFRRIRPPLLTCEAVLSEACFLLRQVSGGTAAVMDLLSRGVITVPFRLDAELENIERLLARYVEVPMSLADACLVRLTEQHPSSTVFTVDSDFRIYRRNGRQIIPTLMP